ncbi:hypothetical protein BKP37_14525 [Anaerobacillus alkalilacustris]|uniref:SipL SPOCS domain-containing protein n=1 Tax=Anaerobacillus alkalilacustris TaxID=393763 RepID=A0A1S2LHU9_9BACI|nr:DUF3794 domain-containing protein [Anaerobacillus alkalilacustris]OIJ12092.1 hypothetical protein BKP37_14525 [Anaerobacillus alkalilacustris]
MSDCFPEKCIANPQSCCQVMVENITQLVPPALKDDDHPVTHTKILRVDIEKVCPEKVVICGVVHKTITYTAVMSDGTLVKNFEKKDEIPFQCFIDREDANEDDPFEIVGAEVLCDVFACPDNIGTNYGHKVFWKFKEKEILKICIRKRPGNDGDGCTRTIGFYKNHEDVTTALITQASGTIFLGDVGGAKTKEVTTFLEALNFFNFQGDASNGINRLYAQLLAAKLNIVSGASDDAVEDVIDDADQFLANHDETDWAALTTAQKQQVNSWKDLLDFYNNGIIGPGHCS